MTSPASFAAPTDEESETVDSTERGQTGISRRTVLGTMAMASVAVACDPTGSDEAGPTNTVADTVLDGEAGRFPDELPFFDEGTSTTSKPSGGGTSSTSKPQVGDPGGGGTTTTSGGGGGTTATTSGSGGTTTTTAGGGTTTTPTTAPATTSPTTAPTTTPTTAPTTTTPPTTAPTTTTTVPPPPEPTALLLANRATFGTTAQIEADIASLGVAGWIDQQLALSTADPATETRLDGFRSLRVSRQQMYSIAQEDNDPIREELVHSTVLRACYSSHQLLEMMAHLWMDHFNIYIDSGRWEHLHIDYQENVIRPNALGRFEDLLRATAESPAMLYYLDNHTSNANSSQGVNENYGRELLELHTLGIDPQGNQIYDETDVRGASLIMSGWSVVTDRNDPNYSDFLYRSNYHWTDPVSILGGGFSSAGLAGKAAGDALITYLAHHPTTARHIAYKLIRRFVSDDPPSALITSTAQVFLQNDTALAPTVRHILLSPEFAQSTGAKMRRPFELVIAALRNLGCDVPNGPLSDGADEVYDRLRDLNHRPWTWEQPDGFADAAGPWLSSDGLLERWAFTARAANDNLGNDPDSITTDIAALRGTAATVGDLITDFQARFGVPGLSAAQRSSIVSTLGVAETDPASSLDDDQVGELASFLLAHPQYQLR